MLCLLERLDVFPQFARYLRVFGLKEFQRDEALGGFDLRLDVNPDSGIAKQFGTLKKNTPPSLIPSKY